MPHVCAGSVWLAANLAVAATVPAIRASECPLHLVRAWRSLAGAFDLGIEAIIDGTLAVPDGVGLGVRSIHSPWPSTATRLQAHGCPGRSPVCRPLCRGRLTQA